MTTDHKLSYQLPLGKHLGVITRLYVGALSRRLDHLDLERHYSILILLEKNEQGCTQQYISNYLKVDKASMVRITDILAKKGYIKKQKSKVDRREHQICLTEKAKTSCLKYIRLSKN